MKKHKPCQIDNIHIKCARAAQLACQKTKLEFAKIQV